MTLDDLKRIQQIGTELLVEVDRICKKLDIEYYLMYGTLLGAVRHQGPIPWDDDVDIGMTRENYKRFLQLAPSELDPRFEIVVMGSGSTEYLSEIKVGKKGTKYYLPGTADLKIMHEIQLDVFLIDAIKKESIGRPGLDAFKRLIETCKLNWDEKVLIMRCIDKSEHSGKLLYKAGLYLLHVVRAIVGEKAIEKLIYHMYVDKKEQSGFYGVLLTAPKVRVWGKTNGVSTLMYDGKEFPVPNNYDEVLRARYGDYMRLPPEDKRYKNHFEDWIFEESL